MKLLFSNEWLRRKFDTDPDDDPEAGPSLSEEPTENLFDELEGENVVALGERNVVQMRVALGVLVGQLRRRDGLTMAELAERAQVSEDELRQVEHDPHYTARPRLIFQLSKYFGVALASLSQMSGTTRAVERKLYNDAVQYAARSDDVSVLTPEQLEVLNAFVAMLNERSKA
jgi:transcriptional regulator with XRE-family HTH domain